MKEKMFDVLKQLDYLGFLRHDLQQRGTKNLPVHQAQLPLLKYIHHHPGCTQSELAEVFLVTPSSIAISTKRMEKGGLIQKEINPENMRQNQLFITDKGKEMGRQGREVFREIDQAMFSGVDGESLDQISQLLGQFIDNLAVLSAQKGGSEIKEKEGRFSHRLMYRQKEEENAQKTDEPFA